MSGRSIAIVIHEGVQALDVAGLLDVFVEANSVLPEGGGYRITVVGREVKPISASNGLMLTPHMDFEGATSSFSAVLVAGGPALPEQPADLAMSRWLCDWGTRAERYGSICTGAFALGRAGLLDGRAVTTHWQNAARLASMFPAARVEHDRIYLRDGPLVTSAGVTAGVDLALSLMGEDHGAELALACAKRLVPAHRQGGAPQFGARRLPASPAHPRLAKAQAYALDHLTEAFSVDQLAQVAGVSTRSLARLFSAELGLTPHQFVESLRIDRARNLLEATRQPLKVIAYECGFGSAERMRQAFQRRLGTSPERYRQRPANPSDRIP